jgi:hypothetical protein
MRLPPVVADIGKGYCSWFYDKICGVNFAVHCYDHDAAYLAGGFSRKLKADVDLLKCVWKAGDTADTLVKKLEVKAIAVIMYAGVSIPGIFFWLKTQLEVMNDSTRG